MISMYRLQCSCQSRTVWGPLGSPPVYACMASLRCGSTGSIRVRLSFRVISSGSPRAHMCSYGSTIVCGTLLHDSNLNLLVKLWYLHHYLFMHMWLAFMCDLTRSLTTRLFFRVIPLDSPRAKITYGSTIVMWYFLTGL